MLIIIWSIRKTTGVLFRHFICEIKYATFDTSVFTNIKTMVFNVMIIFIISVFMFEFFLANAAFFGKSSLCSIIFIACSLKGLQNFWIESSASYTLCLFSIPSNLHIVDIEYLQEICSPTFVVNGFSKLFLYFSDFLFRDSRSV